MVCGCCLCCCPGRKSSSSVVTVGGVQHIVNGKMSSKGGGVHDDGTDTVNLSDRGIDSLSKVSYIFNLTSSLRVLILSHNKLTSLPYEIDRFVNLEHLNLFNNYLPDLPSSLSNLTKLRILNIGMNNLSSLPRGIGNLKELEILDCTYNFLDENSFYPEFFTLANLKALYLSDNEFELIPADIRNLQSLQFLAFRDNNLLSLPSELGLVSRLRELLINNNRLRMIPPELSNLDLLSQRSVLRMDGNPLDRELHDQLKIGVSHVIDFIRTDYYRTRYVRHLMEMSTISPPPKNEERKNRKLLRLKGK